MISDLILYDRSRSTTDWTCPRKRYFNYEYDGIGLESESLALELYLGTTFHDGAAVIATQWKADGKADIDSIASAARKQVYDAVMKGWDGADEFESIEFANEQACLSEGLLRAFYRAIWPDLMSSHKIVDIEKELMFRHDLQGVSDLNGPFMFMAKPDLLLEDNDGNLIYFEYKTTSSKKDQWINSWGTAIQLHSTVRAIEQSLGIKPTGVVVQGVYKGYESYGKQSSPFCYAYRRSGHPPFTQDEFTYEYKAGFRRHPVWELEGGVKKWVDDMPLGIIGEQFPRTPMIFIKDLQVDNFFKQRATREWEISMLGDAENALDFVFPQRFDQCTPAWGHPCAFRRLCHGNAESPLENGFTYRKPHHLPEIEAQKEKNDQELPDL